MKENPHTFILGCTSLQDYIAYTQQKLGTNYPVRLLPRIYHRDPAEMREHVLQALAELPPDAETVLVAMGFCGGSWDRVQAPCRLVMPRIDDCISLLLTTTDQAAFDRKEPGHLYVKDKDPGKTSFRKIFAVMTTDKDKETKARYHRDWQRYYHEIDIIETEINDSRRPEYVAEVKADADWLEAEMAYVPGGTHLLEKLLTGQWDEQFLVLEAGQPVAKQALETAGEQVPVTGDGQEHKAAGGQERG